MTDLQQQKIDIFTHIIPMEYKEALLKELPEDSLWRGVIESTPVLSDVEQRLKIIDKFEGLAQVLTISGPPPESFGHPKSVELARIANDGLADLVSKYPKKFVAAVACLPMDDIGAALKETDRAIRELKFSGILLNTPINDKPLDAPEFMPIYEKMSRYDLPIWIHPSREDSCADYKSESKSKYNLFRSIGWPYETSAAMARLVYSCIFEKYPDLKFITHHCGAMVPFFITRLTSVTALSTLRRERAPEALKERLTGQFKMFYADTANIDLPALTCGYQFFGASHILFGTDMPYGSRDGYSFIKDAIERIQQMDITENEQVKIFEENAKQLLLLKDF